MKWRDLLRPWAAVAVGAGGSLFLDLWTKRVWFIPGQLETSQGLARLIQLTDHRNQGLSFDVPLPAPLILGISVILLFLAVFLLARHATRKELVAVTGLSIFLGGALGNLYDRAVIGYVRDWILLWGRSAINLADLFILVGAAIYAATIRRRSPPQKENTSGTDLDQF